MVATLPCEVFCIFPTYTGPRLQIFARSSRSIMISGFHLAAAGICRCTAGHVSGTAQLGVGCILRAEQSCRWGVSCHLDVGDCRRIHRPVQQRRAILPRPAVQRQPQLHDRKHSAAYRQRSVSFHPLPSFGGVASIAVCLSVCPLVCLRNNVSKFATFLFMLTVAVACDDTAVHYILPVLWLMSYFHVICHTCQAHLQCPNDAHGVKSAIPIALLIFGTLWTKSFDEPRQNNTPSAWHHDIPGKTPMTILHSPSLLERCLLCYGFCVKLGATPQDPSRGSMRCVISVPHVCPFFLLSFLILYIRVQSAEVTLCC